MIPNTGLTESEFESILDSIDQKKYFGADFQIIGNRIGGLIDGTVSLEQTINNILQIERYKYNTVSDNVGVEFWNLYGRNDEFIELDLRETIENAILTDNRVARVEEIEIEDLGQGKYNCKVVTQSNLGDILSIEREVNIKNV